MTERHVRRYAIAMIIAAALPSATEGADATKATSAQIARGRYLVTVGNCNDCHTKDFAEREGNVPESQWLKGNPLGFKGPWGTTYAPNLRLTVSGLTEARWVTFAKALKVRPPMPWYTVNRWSDSDLRALYRYIKGLGPAGPPAPQYVPPDKQPDPPFIQWPAPPK